MLSVDRYGSALYLYFKILTCILLCCNSNGKEFSGPNVCWKTINKEPMQYCCLNYYYDKGKCKACNPGSKSLDGITCVPCPPNTYGEMCKYKCNCGLKQNCNRKFGCIDNISSAVTLWPSTEEEGYIYNFNVTYSGFKRSESSTTFSIEQEDTEDHKKDTDANRFIYYLVVAGGLVGWLVFCFAAVRFVCKKIKRERPSRHLLSPVTEVRAVERPLPVLVLPNESIYNEIEDEIEAVPSSYLTACHSSSYLSVKDDSEKSFNSSTTETNSICEISISPPKNEDLEENDSLSDNSLRSFDECNANKNEDYLHPYTTLQVDNGNTCSYTH